MRNCDEKSYQTCFHISKNWSFINSEMKCRPINSAYNLSSQVLVGSRWYINKGNFLFPANPAIPHLLSIKWRRDILIPSRFFLKSKCDVSKTSFFMISSSNNVFINQMAYSKTALISRMKIEAMKLEKQWMVVQDFLDVFKPYWNIYQRRCR